MQTKTVIVLSALALIKEEFSCWYTIDLRSLINDYEIVNFLLHFFLAAV